MDIVFTIDEKFTRFCAVAIASLLKHNKTEEIWLSSNFDV